VHGNHEVDHPPASRNINAPAAWSTPFLFGTTQFGLGLVFLTVGDYFVSATENALINTLETPPAVA
jgi:hypothetical protein